MRRRSTTEERPYRSFDFYEEVEPKRLQAIGAISLAWNWLEGALDTAFAVAFDIHPTLWTEVISRINGMDAKLELLRRSARLYEDVSPSWWIETISKTLNAVGSHKTYRDGVIHVRLVHPDAQVADTPRRKGNLDEVLVSQQALDGLYRRIRLLAQEANLVASYFTNRWLTTNGSSEAQQLEAAELLVNGMKQLQDLQRARESLEPLPDFPISH